MGSKIGIALAWPGSLQLYVQHLEELDSFICVHSAKNDSEEFPLENVREPRVSPINFARGIFLWQEVCIYTLWTAPPESPAVTRVSLMMSLITALLDAYAPIRACQRFSECTVFTSSYISTFRVIIMNHDIFPVKVIFGIHPKDVKVLNVFLGGSDLLEKVYIHSFMNLKWYTSLS